MSTVKNVIARTPTLGRFLLIFYRGHVALKHVRGPFSALAKWLLVSKETTNFTYDLEDSNKRYLTSLIALISNERFAAIAAYIDELETDRALQEHIAAAIGGSQFAFVADRQARFGRRLGWYALARALKPRTIVETGVDKGLGSCVLTAALKRNHAEGFQGCYYGTDINPQAGYLLGGEYAKYGRILYGDSIKTLTNLQGPIDLFINDSDHSAEYEADEYRMIASKLSPRAVILGDNAHCTDKLLEFSMQSNREFVFFQEKPKEHWYPGGGIGISFARSSLAHERTARDTGVDERGIAVVD